MSKRMAVVSLMVAGSFGLFASADPPPATVKRALLVGINAYQAPTVPQLHGCVNDVTRMRSVLVNRYGFDPANIVMLTDGKATRAAILAALDKLAADSHANDTVVVHYSGHGSRTPDLSGDETDNFDETIVPVDSRTGTVHDITDDELNLEIASITQKTSNVTVVLDSCFSGTATRGGATVRLAPDESAPPGAQAVKRGGIADGPTDLRSLAASYVLISAARPTELANEYMEDADLTEGALTHFLCRRLEGAPTGATYRDVALGVSNDVSALFPSQHPQIEGGRADALLFQTALVATDASVNVSPVSATRVHLDAGEIAGLTAGSELKVYPPFTKKFDGSIPSNASVRVVAARPFDADAEIVAGTIAPLSRAAIDVGSYVNPSVSIFYAANPAAVAEVKEKLRGVSLIREATSEARAELILADAGKGLVLKGADLRPLLVVDASASATKRIANAAIQWAKWLNVQKLGNSLSDLPVRMSLELPAGSRGNELMDGDALIVNIQNDSSQPVYVTLLDLSSDGSVSIWYPLSDQVDAVAAGKPLRKQIDMFVPDGVTHVSDTVKLIATTTQIDAGLFVQPPITDSRAAIGKTALDLLFESFASGGSRNGRPSAVTSWMTSSQTVTVRARDKDARGFLMHFEARADEEGIKALLPKCGIGQPLCYEAQSVSPDGAVVEAFPAGTRGDAVARGSRADLWDEAYRLREVTGALRVEPDSEYEVSGNDEDDAAIGTRGGRERPDKTGAVNDNRWSLKYAGVPKAWRMLQAGGHADGQEAKGIVVAHPDTGYRKHLEIWSQSEASSAVAYEHGYDYVDRDDDAFDPLDTSGLLSNPGHGTKSGSVIVSPKGKQWSGGTPTDFVDGVAPGARLVPLRVHRSVVHFNPANLAKAIYEAAGTDRTHVKLAPHVVSISMGGVPTWTLWRAVRYAKERGVIVVAAAGNEVGFVVWPARFDETIAVAAINVDCGVWDGSSRGSAVDISAPGESVWCAITAPNGVDSVRMGQGTTFATATLAGTAALWLSSHWSEPRLQELRRQGQVTDVFRSLLRATSWRPDGDPLKFPEGVRCSSKVWDADNLGAGIVDAGALLAAPLPASAGATRAIAPTVGDLPLFGSLFPADTDRETIRSRYLGIFPIGAANPGVFEAEIMQKYGEDTQLRGAIDTIVNVPSPTAEQYAAVRSILLALDTSRRLQQALRSAQ